MLYSDVFVSGNITMCLVSLTQHFVVRFIHMYVCVNAIYAQYVYFSDVGILHDIFTILHK